MELVKLRQQQQSTRAYLQSIELRLQGTETKQQEMMSFLARAAQNPTFLEQLVQQKEKRKELEEAISKKRHRSIDQGHSGDSIKKLDPVKAEPLEFERNTYGFEVSELEALALEMQGFGRARKEKEEEEEEHDQQHEQFESGEKELDEEFWEALLNEKFDQDLGLTKGEESEEENMNALADRSVQLGSSHK